MNIAIKYSFEKPLLMAGFFGTVFYAPYMPLFIPSSFKLINYDNDN